MNEQLPAAFPVERQIEILQARIQILSWACRQLRDENARLESSNRELREGRLEPSLN